MTRTVSIPIPAGSGNLFYVTALAALLLACLPRLPMAQGLSAQEAIESIIGSQVQVEEQAGSSTEDVLHAIENAAETAMEARAVFRLDTVTIVFVPEADQEGSQIAEAVAENRSSIRSLRQAVQGNAMLFHSLDSQSILLDDVLGIDFATRGEAKIYVAGDDPRP